MVKARKIIQNAYWCLRLSNAFKRCMHRAQRTTTTTTISTFGLRILKRNGAVSVQANDSLHQVQFWIECVSISHTLSQSVSHQQQQQRTTNTNVLLDAISIDKPHFTHAKWTKISTNTQQFFAIRISLDNKCKHSLQIKSIPFFDKRQIRQQIFHILFFSIWNFEWSDQCLHRPSI